MRTQKRGWEVLMAPLVPSKGRGSAVGFGSSRRWVADIDCQKIAGGYGCNQPERPKWVQSGRE